MEFTTRRAILMVFLILFSVGCNSRFFSPFSSSSTSNDGLLVVDTPEGPIRWSPYIVVQPDGGATEGYKRALIALISRGNLRGVRMTLSSYRESVTQMISSLQPSFGRIEITGIIPNGSLFDSNPEAMIDRYILAYPDVEVFQIGNEVTTINQSQGLPPMTIEQYMDIFKRIYNHVQSRYPLSPFMLMTQSTFGSGTYGSEELKKMVALGLTPDVLLYKRVIVGVNIYSDSALNEYVSTRNQYLNSEQGSYRVWVMETGTDDPARHISHVKLYYPRLAGALGAERIYWYVLWGGDTGSDINFGLISNPYNPDQMTYSPLFKALAGIQ